jgi:cytochrome P450
MLMAARDRDTGEGMPDRQLVNETMTLIVAGHETTASTLNWVWYLLSQHPEAETKLSCELENLCSTAFSEFGELSKFTYVRQVIDETLRLYPAGWLMTRKALADDQLGEYFVPAGTEIYISPYYIQRNPSLWEEPDHFNPDRFAPGHSSDRHPLATLPFSAGPRNCIGEFFARLEMQVHLITLAKRLRMHYLDGKTPELDVGVNLRSKRNFIMTPEIRD